MICLEPASDPASRSMSIEATRGRQGNIRDSGYYRLFESQSTDDRYDGIAQDLARLVSKIHSASICNGNRLEQYISKDRYNSNRPHTNHTITNLVTIGDGHYTNVLFPKELWNDESKTQSTEVDYMVVSRPADTTTDTDTETPVRTVPVDVMLFEIKDGDTFDTKKSREELKSLECVRTLLEAGLPGARVRCYVVLWNCKDISKNGFKAKMGRSSAELINGETMCAIAGGISYNEIVHERKSIGDENLLFCITKMRDLVRIYDELGDAKPADALDDLSEMLRLSATLSVPTNGTTDPQ